MARATFPFDIQLGDINFRARLVAGRFGLAQGGPDLSGADQPVEWTSYEGGGGYAHAGPTNPPNVFHYARHVTTRTGTPLPGPRLQQCTWSGAQPGTPIVGSLITSGGVLQVVGGTGVFEIAGTVMTRAQTFAGALTDCSNYKGVQVYARGQSAPVITCDDGAAYVASLDLYLHQLAQVYWETTVEGGTRGQYLGATEGVATTRASIGAGHVVPTHFRYFSSEGTPAAIATALRLAANWIPNPGLTQPIGNTAYAINSLVSGPRDFRFGKPDGIYGIDEVGRTPNYAPYLARQLDLTYNGAAGFVHQGYAYFGTRRGQIRVNMLDRSQMDVPQACHPGAWMGSEAGMFGPNTANCADGGYLVSAYFDGRNSWITYEQDRAEAGKPGPGPMVHYIGELYLANEKVHHMAVIARAGEPPMLYLFSHPYNDATTIKGWRVVLSNSGNPLVDWLAAGTGFSYSGANAYQFSTGLGTDVENPQCYLFLPREYWGVRTLKKVLLTFDSLADNLAFDASGATVRGVVVFYRADSLTAAFTGFGTVNASPRSFTTFETINDVVQAYGLDIQIALVGQNTSPPVLRSMLARASLIPERRETRTYQIIISAVPELKGGGGGGGFARRDAHEDWRRTHTRLVEGPFLGIDHWRRRIIFKMEDFSVGEPIETDDGWVHPANVTLTVIRDLGRAS